MMELSLRCRYWSVLHVVAIVVYYRGNVECERAQGCVGSQLSLRCPEMKVIQIAGVVLGDSHCSGSSCCIIDDDCTYNANGDHRTDVHRRCDNKQSCTVGVVYGKIPCGYWGVWYYNDFERITYNCVDDPHLRSTSTTSTTSLKPVSTENNMPTEENTSTSGTENESSTKDCHLFADDTESSTDVQSTESFDQITITTDQVEIESPEYQSDNPWLLPVVMTTVCLLILIAIVFVVVMMKRKRMLKDSAAIEMTEGDSNLRNEIINENGNETMSLDNGSGSPIYSNDKIKQSKNKDTNVSQNYEVPNNCVAGHSGPTPREDPYMYCDVDSSEPAYQVPRPMSNLYSIVRDIREPECAGSTADTTNEYYNAHCDVKTKEPAKAVNSSAQNTNDEACSLKENQCEALKDEKSSHMTQTTTMKTKTDCPDQKTVQNPYANFNKTSQKQASEEAASKDKVGAIDGLPNTVYEEMFPLIPESVYANAPVLSPNSSVISRAIPMEATVTENPYCEMKSPPVKSKDSGN